jgi:lipopolysaccharide biosynthesis regulator YciM
MQELLWLLLPVAAASGWWGAMRSVRKPLPAPPDKQNPAYFHGLNHLLNEEPDKAIDIFVEMLEVDSETVETHLALGNLFRQRGEVERAIRIHQNLIARPTLSNEQHAQALLELGQDYLRAGLYDRAEKLFQELKEKRLHTAQVLQHLTTIYQQEKEWQACLQTAEALEKHSQQDLSLEKSHYYCELAMQAKAAEQYTKAHHDLKAALATNPACVRANHLMARLAWDKGDIPTAMQLLRDILDHNVHYLPEIIREMIAGHQKLGTLQDLRALLEQITGQHPKSGAELYVAELIQLEEGNQPAAQYLTRYIRNTPSLPGLRQLVELECLNHGQHHLLCDVLNHLNKILQKHNNYQCHKCGFQASTLHWQCPSCHRWSTIQQQPPLENL